MSVASEVTADSGPDTGELVLSWMESVQTALLVVDADLEVHWANPLAREWIAAKEPLSQVGTQLHIGRSQQQLRRLINRAGEQMDGICVPIEGRGAHLILSARKITDGDSAPYYGLIARCTDDVNAQLMGVEEAFRLTAAELRVLKLLLKGQTAQAIAVSLSVSIETVRTHIRRLYTKLEVGSREALFMRLRPFMIAS